MTWDGRPENPERDDWHIVNGGPKRWDAAQQVWRHSDGVEWFTTELTKAVRYGWNYKGVMAFVTHAEIAARERAARQAGWDACVEHEIPARERAAREQSAREAAFLCGARGHKDAAAAILALIEKEPT